MTNIFMMAIWLYMITFLLIRRRIRHSSRHEQIREFHRQRREGFLRILFILALPYIIAAGFLRGIIRRLRSEDQR